MNASVSNKRQPQHIRKVGKIDMKAFQNAMAAVAYAEAGEFETAREILKARDEKKKRVILGINDADIKPRLINYAYDLSQRVGGQLEVLQIIAPENVGRTLEYMNNPQVEKMREKGIAYKILTGMGTIEENILQYAREKRNILLVLLKSIQSDSDELNAIQVMGKLKCPVVVFSDIV